MPRPPIKRNKLNHPTPSKRVANASKISPVAELQRKLANKPIGRVLTDSDDSDKLVTSKKNGRNRGGMPRKEIYASGGVGLGDEPGAHRSQKKLSQVSQRVDTRNLAGKEKTVAATQKVGGGKAAKPAVNSQSGRRNSPIHSSQIAPGSTTVSRAPTRLQNTPARDTSILGTIKPRRRQASILQLLGNNDSSNIEDEDEDDFLPNDESTPLQHSTALATTSTPNSSLSHSSTSQKRKRTPPITLVPASQQSEESLRSHSQGVDAADEPRSEAQLPVPRRSGTAPLQVTHRPDDAEIMAPPLSSSPLKSPAKSVIRSPVKKAPAERRKQPLAPSTNELRTLMPTRRQRKGRLRTQPANDFDIPADASNDDSDGRAGPTVDSDNDDLSFRAGMRGRKSNAAALQKAKLARKPTNVRAKGREKSTISPTKLVTPLKRPPTQKSAAKSSLSQQQQPPRSHGSTIKTSTKGNATTKATYSSSRRRHQHDISGDKENRPVDSSDAFSGGEASPVEGGEDLLELSIEDVDKIKPTKEIQSIVKKFADVDAWEMEFEDVSLGGNSSPNRR